MRKICRRWAEIIFLINFTLGIQLIYLKPPEFPVEISVSFFPVTAKYLSEKSEL
jgi:hypothetical protein